MRQSYWDGLRNYALLIGLACNACSYIGSQVLTDAKTAQTKMVGMTEGEVLQCAGIPDKTYALSKTKYLSYFIGEGTSSSASLGNMSASFGEGHCTATIALDQGRVTSVRYEAEYPGQIGADTYAPFGCGRKLKTCLAS